MKYAYADPPYLGLGSKLYGKLHSEAGDWDDPDTHRGLVERLRVEYPEGWALSCNPRDLSLLLPLVPETRVCVWTKTYHQIRVNVAVQYAWEPVLLSGGRPVFRRKPLVRDWHASATSSSDPSLVGAKPPAFCRWVLDLLGFDPDEDTLDDLFPGSGVMGRAVDGFARQEALL